MNNWHLITDENFAALRQIVVTNNIDARRSDGRMSHIWLAQMVHRDDSGEFTVFDCADRRVRCVTHYMPVEPPAASLDRPMGETEKRAAWQGFVEGASWMSEPPQTLQSTTLAEIKSEADRRFGAAPSSPVTTPEGQ